MVSYTSGLSWPRSDGDKSSFPTATEQIPSKTNNWWERLDPSAEKYKLYEEKVGKHVAEKLKISAASYRMALPSNYAIFTHHKPQGGGLERTDAYLFGSPLIGKFKFRSPNEFLPHVDWLFDTSLKLDDHSTCPCIYNKSSELARVKKAGGGNNSPAGPSKRPLAVTDRPAKKSKNTPRRSGTPASDYDPPRPSVVPERELDTTTSRRFRKGELVWFRIPTITSPHPPDLASSDAPSITHWPGLVAQIVTISTVINGVNGAGGKIVSVSRYMLRPLGSFHPGHEVSRGTEDILPWAVGNDLLGGQSGWERIGSESTKIISEGVKREAEKDQEQEIEEKVVETRWKKRWVERKPFGDYFKGLSGGEKDVEWDAVVFRMGMALKTAASITNSWTQTDKIDVLPDSEVNKEDLEDILAQKKTLYQGLWWGGERIWMEDMVRLRKERSDLPSDALTLPSEGADSRAVFLRVRMITIEVSPDSTPEVTAWRCLLYGDVFELAVANPGESSETSLGPLQPGEVPLVLSYKAPKAYVYRQLNNSGSEVTVDVMDIAGRAYPDLLEGATQNWYIDPKLSDAENAERKPSGESVKAVTGLLPGTQLFSSSEKWKEDLYNIVFDATKSVDKDMRRFYETLLKKNGVNIVPNKELVKSPVKNGNGVVDSLAGSGAGGTEVVPSTLGGAEGAMDVDAVGTLPVQAAGVAV